MLSSSAESIYDFQHETIKFVSPVYFIDTDEIST